MESNKSDKWSDAMKNELEFTEGNKFWDLKLNFQKVANRLGSYGSSS